VGDVLRWLLELRRKKIAVIIVHHSGRSGQTMRGTSRREDSAFWIIRLEEKADMADKRYGARFLSIFTKQRNTPEEIPGYEWSFQPDSNTGCIQVQFKEAAALDVVLQWIRDGLASCQDIARETGWSNGQVSKLAKKLTDSGKVMKKGREYLPSMRMPDR
jgi:putative DNA primase/helicase